MRHCPHCRAEIDPALDRCPHCGGTLVVPVEPVPLIMVEDNAQYAILSGLLTQAQIPFFLQDEGSGSYLRMITGYSVYRQTIYVNRADYDAANACLDGYYRWNPRTRIFSLSEEEEAAGAAAQEAESGTHRGFVTFLLAFVVVLLLLWLSVRL